MRMVNGQVRQALARDVTEVRRFRGLPDEISREMRLIPKHKRPAVEKLTDHKVLLARLRFATTVVYGVEDIRLFNGDNHETTRFSFHSQYITVKENEERVIAENHDVRMEVIRAFIDGNSSVATVSFIPGGVDHIRLTADDLSKCWQDELDTFCAALGSLACRNSHLRNVHFETKLCRNLNIDHLLQSSLEEISLPDLKEKWWRDFAAKLARNQTLRVVTVQYDMKKMNAFLQTPSSRRQGEPISESWTTCNQTMKTLCISLPTKFRANVQVEAEAMASTLYRARSVSAFVIEYSPLERPPELRTFAKCCRQALVRAPNVSVLHLLVPFRGQELREHILTRSFRQLTCLILVLDLWGKNDLKAAKNMIRDSPKLEVFGLRRQNPKRKLSFLKRRLLFQEITTAGIAMFLGHDRVDETSLQILSLRGWDLVDGEMVSAALDNRLQAQPNLLIDLTGTGFLLKNKRAAHAVSEVSSESGRSTTTGFSSSHNTSQACNNGSVYLSAMSRMSGMALSAGASTSGSSFHDRRNHIFDHDELGSHHYAGPGSVWAATPEHHTLPQQQQDQQQQQHSGRQQGSPIHFSIFSFDQLQEATGNFDPDALIGRGGFGQVYFGELTTPDSGKQEVAVKDLNLDGVNWQRVVKSFDTEVRTLGNLHHKNLVRLLGYCTHDQRYLLVYEFMPNSSLDRWIFRDGELPWATRVSIAVGVARGLTYLHIECNHTIIHLDIKPQNILLDGQMVPKLADFGIAKLVVDTEQTLATLTRAQGTERYMAPEIYQSNRVTPQSDVFSFGLLLIEILRGRRNSDPMPPVDEDSYMDFPFWARKKFQTGQYMTAFEQLAAPVVSPLIPGYQEKEAEKMLCIAIACINEEMVKRPNMRTVMHMLEDREPVPDPSQSRPPGSYGFRLYESNTR